MKIMNDQDVQKLIGAMKETLTTKDDLKSFATKDDLGAFATKDDLKSFATKDDLDKFPTAEMVLRGFEEAKTDRAKLHGTVGEIYAEVNILTDRLDDMRELVAKVPNTHDMEAILEKTYKLNQMKTEFERIKRIIHEKLGVEV